MTGLLDKVSRQVASDMVNKFGKAITLIRVTEGTYDLTSGTTTNTEVLSSINCVVTEFTSYDFVNGLAVQGDKKVIIAAQDVAIPSLADKLTVDGVTYSIVSIGSTSSGELDAIYTLQARRM